MKRSTFVCFLTLSVVQVLLLKISNLVCDVGKHQNLLDIHLIHKFYIIIVFQGIKKIEIAQILQ